MDTMGKGGGPSVWGRNMTETPASSSWGLRSKEKRQTERDEALFRKSSGEEVGPLGLTLWLLGAEDIRSR